MEFEEFPKIPRLNREVVCTEKIDGTNAQILITTFKDLLDYRMIDNPDYLYETADEVKELTYYDWDEYKKDKEPIWYGTSDGSLYMLMAGSKSRWLTEDKDNYGFWHWVNANKVELVKLGFGRHYGEWWGQGINRGYGLQEKRFSLFNVTRWKPQGVPSCCHVVPTIVIGTGYGVVNTALDKLRTTGSYAMPGYMKPEGVVAFHSASNDLYKVTLEKDNEWKGKNKKDLIGPAQAGRLDKNDEREENTGSDIAIQTSLGID